MVFNATFNIHTHSETTESDSYPGRRNVVDCGLNHSSTRLGCLMPLSIIFQIYRGVQFLLVEQYRKHHQHVASPHKSNN
jgi:hypothetical protein